MSTYDVSGRTNKTLTSEDELSKIILVGPLFL